MCISIFIYIYIYVHRYIYIFIYIYIFPIPYWLFLIPYWLYSSKLERPAASHSSIVCCLNLPSAFNNLLKKANGTSSFTYTYIGFSSRSVESNSFNVQLLHHLLFGSFECLGGCLSYIINSLRVRSILFTTNSPSCSCCFAHFHVRRKGYPRGQRAGGSHCKGPCS